MIQSLIHYIITTIYVSSLLIYFSFTSLQNVGGYMSYPEPPRRSSRPRTPSWRSQQQRARRKKKLELTSNASWKTPRDLEWRVTAILAYVIALQNVQCPADGWAHTPDSKQWQVARVQKKRYHDSLMKCEVVGKARLPKLYSLKNGWELRLGSVEENM